MDHKRPSDEDRFAARRREHAASNGQRPQGKHARPVPLPEAGRPDAVDDPVDIMAVQADDELISALASGMQVSTPGVTGYDADDHVIALLAAWRAEVDAAPVPELVDLDTAVAAVASSRSSIQARNRRRQLAPLAGAAALIVVAVFGVSLTAEAAQPGDALWGVSKVLYSERAESVEAAAGVQTRLERARVAMENGQTELAAQELEAAQAELPAVRAEEGHSELIAQRQALAVVLEETDPEALDEEPAVVAEEPAPTEPDPPVEDSPSPEPDPTTPPTTPPDGTEPTPSPPPTTEGAAEPSGTAEGTTEPADEQGQGQQPVSEGSPATGTTASGGTGSGGTSS